MTVVVVGLGGMGSAALFHLARRGATVIGLEQFGAAHMKGASHGRSRIIRQAYFEDPRYVPLLKRAYELWAELNAGAPEPVWRLCGGVAIGTRDCALIEGNVRSALLHSIEHEVLERNDAGRRFPAFALRRDEVALYEPTVGMLFPELCVAEHLRAALAAGAQARFHTTVRDISTRGEAIVVQLSSGERIECDRLVLTAGPWIGDFARFPVRVERNVQHWFEPRANPPEHIFMVERPTLSRLLYGFPDVGEGVKAAFHHSGEFLQAPAEHSDVTREDEVGDVRSALDEVLSGGAGRHVRSEPCMYAVTPDEHFIIGSDLERPNITVACGFSGHGFKFCSVVGEILADLVLEDSSGHDISLFDPHWPVLVNG